MLRAESPLVSEDDIGQELMFNISKNRASVGVFT